MIHAELAVASKMLLLSGASRLLCRGSSSTRSFSVARTTWQEAEKLSRTAEVPRTSSVGGPLDEPPLLFVKKHSCIVDVRAIRLPEPPPEETSSATVKRKIRMVQEAAAAADTLDSLAVKLTSLASQREALPTTTTPFPPVVSSSIGENAFVDEDIVRNSRLTMSADHQEENDGDLLNWTDTRLEVRKLPGYYLSLSKSRLTTMVCITTAAGYGLGPGALDPATFVLTVLGTGLLSASANSINQYLEVPFDSQMNRTKNRVLVRGLLSPLHAVSFAAVAGASGALVLATQVNVVAASLRVANLLLYTCVYTPMKRVSVVNTWVGSVVGALPPLIGWAGAAGGVLDPGAAVLAGLLYCWQFPHFNSLSWNLRPDYSRAGYRMMSVTHPALCRRVALRHSVACQVLCMAASAVELAEPHFALEALPVNAILIYLAWDFYRKADSSSSRKLFRYSLLHLPLLMTLLFVSKKRKREHS